MKILDHDAGREDRCGIPEVVYGAGKSPEDLAEISSRMLEDTGRAIITKIDLNKAEHVLRSVDGGKYQITHNKKGRVLIIKRPDCMPKKIGEIAIFTAGTSDIPIAEEARAIAEELGCDVRTEYDVGIAGIHRVMKAVERLKETKVFIVVAGMEGALPSVVSGLVKGPVIGVPTSVGYGTCENGRTPLYTMLNSCTPIATVNIDNGYGAAVLAYKILIV